MIPSNTICVSQEGPANALALNKDSTQVVIAGRNVFKVFSIDENEFSEVCNLRVGKNLNLNYSSIDVAWSSIEENTLATAATNGAVVVWNLGKSGRSKQEHVFSDHKRTVNKVSFHLTEPSLLISGSQDGMMKCFDLRMKEVARTFISNTESIRDVQFRAGASQQFAAVAENGSAQVWDVRRHDRPLLHFTAHSGPVFACDWHPAAPWLATASRDKTIKVWDLQAKPNLEYTIYTIASVGHVKWRPQKRYQVASCALVLDCAVHVWDVRRPHVPLATFAEHRDVTTAIAWQGAPHAFLSTSRDCTLYRHRWAEAAHPVLWANPHAVAASAREVAGARPERPLPRAPPAAAPRAPAAARKQPTAGSLGPAAQAALERAFPAGAASLLTRHRAPAACVVAACATQYRLHGAPLHELAAHNAEVARRHNRHLVAHVWEVVRHVFSGGGAAARVTPAPPPPRDPPRQDPPPHTPPYSSAVVEEEPLEEAEQWAESFHNSGVLGMPTLAIYIPAARHTKLRAAGDEEAGWVSAASAHYVDVEAADWTLPEEAFPLRAPPAPLPHHHDDAHTVTSRGSPGGSSPGAAPPPDLPPPPHAALAEEGEAGELTVRAGETRAAFEAGAWLAAALRAHAELADVQTAACVLLALGERRAQLPAPDDAAHEHWLLAYVELLQRRRLFNAATEAVRGARWLPAVWAVSQHGTALAAACARCARRSCACRPRAPPAACAVCRRRVRGLYAWCQGCAHGGHLLHMRDWLAVHRTCPAGCGHRCQQD